MRKGTARNLLVEYAQLYGVDNYLELAEMVADDSGLLDKNGLVPEWLDNLARDVVCELWGQAFE